MRIQVCSISPERYQIKRMTYRCNIDIPASLDGKPTSVWIEDHEDTKYVYLDVQHIDHIPVPISAKEIVADIFRNEQLEAKGCFIPAGEVPTKEEIAAARAKRIDLLMGYIEEGDKLFAQFGPRGIQHITDYSKRAVRELRKRDCPWAFMPDMVAAECPGCGSSISKLSNGQLPAICKACGTVINQESAIALGLAKEEEPAKRGPGRPRKESTEAVTA